MEFDAFLAACPSRKLLDRISDKWVVLIQLSADCAGEPRSMRYSELSRLLVGVSQKRLTQTLRSLERDGFVTRHRESDRARHGLLRADQPRSLTAQDDARPQDLGRDPHG